MARRPLESVHERQKTRDLCVRLQDSFASLSIADVTHFGPCTNLTRDLTAPMKLTVATFSCDVSLTAEAPPTTQQIAAVDADRGFVALTSGSAEDGRGRRRAEGR